MALFKENILKRLDVLNPLDSEVTLSGNLTVNNLLTTSGLNITNDLALEAADAGDDARVDSPNLIWRATYDADQPGGGITSTPIDLKAFHTITTATGNNGELRLNWKGNDHFLFKFKGPTSQDTAWTMQDGLGNQQILLGSQSGMSVGLFRGGIQHGRLRVRSVNFEIEAFNGTGLFLRSDVPDGMLNVGTIIDTANTFSITGSELISIRNGGVEKAHFDHNGWLVNSDFPNTVFQATSVSDAAITTASGVVQMADMLLTPGIGDFTVLFDTTAEISLINETITTSLFVGGIEIAHSSRTCESGGANEPKTMSTQAYVTGVGGTDDIEVRWSVTAGTATVHNRSMIVEKKR